MMILTLNSIVTYSSQRTALQIKGKEVFQRTGNHHVTVQIKSSFLRHKVRHKIAKIACIVAISLELLDMTTIHTTVNHFTTKGSQMTV